MLTIRKSTNMDERFGKTYLNHLGMLYLQLGGGLSPEGWEKQLQIEKLIDGVKKKLAECLRQRRSANRGKLCETLSCDGRQLDELLKTRPSMDLCEPEDFILYWYIHGEFPGDMCLDEMENTQQAVVNRLNQLIRRDYLDGAYLAYCRAKAEVQLQQLADMIEAFRRDAFDDEEDSCQRIDEKPENTMDWLDEDMDDLMEGPDEESENDEGSCECTCGKPMPLFVLPDEPEHPEDMTIPELGMEIEKQEYNLLCLKSAEGIEKPCLWQVAVDSVKVSLSLLRELLNQRIMKALGAEAEDPSAAKGFEDGDLPDYCGGDGLERAEAIVASWYLSESFSLITSGENLMLVEAALKRQQMKLVLNEPSLENLAEHALWQFRLEQRAVQLDEIQTMQWNQATYGEEWDPEDE